MGDSNRAGAATRQNWGQVRGSLKQNKTRQPKQGVKASRKPSRKNTVHGIAKRASSK